MNVLTMNEQFTKEIIYANIEELCDGLNKATSNLVYRPHEEGFTRMMNVMKALAVFLHFGSGAKDVVCTNDEEPQIVPFPMQPCVAVELPSLGGPGQVFPCPFLVSPLPRANIGSLMSSLSAIAAYNIAITCHRESLLCTDPNQSWQYRLQAKQFYNTAYGFFDRLSYIAPDGSLILAYMAMCTNLAELEFEDGNLDSARHWRAALRNTMACVPEEKGSAVLKHFHNTCIFYRFETPAAQAA